MNTKQGVVLTCNELSMRFGNKNLFSNLSFSYERGATALVGMNGSGKSTLISILCGITKPDQGVVKIDGHDLFLEPRRAKAKLSFVPDESVAYDFMSGTEFLQMVGALRNVEPQRDADALLERFGIYDMLHQKFHSMSLGTKKKFMLVAGLLGDPLLVLMDEPTNAIDSAAKAALIEFIERKKGECLFFFSTHDQLLVEGTSARLLRL